jgi:hypothetical protein
LRRVARHALLLVPILAIVGLAYLNVSEAGYCGYDDFHEGYRAAFFFGPVPSRIATTTHVDDSTYGPVTSALQLVTWRLFDRSAFGFRLRNLTMHLIAVCFVYGIAFLLGRSRVTAAAAAALFGLDPFANEAVVVATWTNTTAYALVLGALFLFLLSLRRLDAERSWIPSLVASLVLVAIALFAYEPSIVAFAVMAAYLAICRLPAPGVPRPFLVVFGAGTAIDVVLFAGVRHLMHVASTGAFRISAALKDTFEYVVALLLPVDPVLAHAVFGAPLPLGAARPALALLAAPALYGVLLLVVFAFAIARPLRGCIASADWRTVVFLLVAIPLALAPAVLFGEHVSEYNLYVPAAFYTIALALVLAQFCRNRTALIAVVCLFLLSFGAGTWARNELVVACAQVVNRIVASLPIDAWHKGTWHVRLATAPGEQLTRPYGIYNYSGIETLEVTVTTIKGAQEALRLASRNPAVDVDVVPAEALQSDCRNPKTCFYVFPDGSVKELDHP